MFERKGGVSRDCVKAPYLLPGLSIVRGDIAPHAKFGTAVPNENFAFRCSGCARDRVETLTVDDGVNFPYLDSCGGIECDQATVETCDVDATLIDGHAPINDVATGASAPFSGDLGIIKPELFAADGVDSKYPTPRTR